MPLTNRENHLRTVRFQHPEWIPMSVHISAASRIQGREEMEEVMARHPLFFPGFQKGQVDFDHYPVGAAYKAGEAFTDAWGCVWEPAIEGLEGVVSGHPLADWSALDGWQAPDALVQLDRSPADWEGARRGIERARAAGALTSGGTAHGFLLMRLWYLRGFENLMVDLATGDPHLAALIERVVEHNRVLVRQWLEMGVDVLHFGEDLGTQDASIISPRAFREWITPAYRSLMAPCREAGTHVYLHSDGYIMDLVDEFVAAGVEILNPQDLCNGLGNLAAYVKGRMCIALDVDRQSVLPFGTRADVHDLIEEEVRTLGSPEGGLMFVVGIYPPTPPENVDALCEALARWRVPSEW